MKKFNLLCAFVASVLLLSSCLKGEDPVLVPVGGMTFINTFIEVDQVYYQLDRTAIQNVSPLRYRAYGFAFLYARENRRLEIYSPYENTRLTDTTFTIQDSVFYSSIVYGTHEAPKHFLTTDRIPEGTENPEAIAAIRFYNLANTPHRVTLRIGDATPVDVFSNRPTETPQRGKLDEQFIPTEPGKYTFTVVDEDGATLAQREFELRSGSYTSIFLTGDEREPTTYYVGFVNQYVN